MGIFCDILGTEPKKSETGTPLPADLIDRTELLQVISDHSAKVGDSAPLQVAVLSWVKTLVQAMPTVDAVQVVRCGECLFWSATPTKEHPNIGVCDQTSARLRHACEYCTRGKRRENHG